MGLRTCSLLVLLALTAINPAGAQQETQAPPSGEEIAEAIQKSVEEEVKVTADRRQATATLSTLSQLLEVLREEEKFGRVSSDEAEVLVSGAVRIAKRIGDLDEDGLRAYRSGVSRRRLVSLAYGVGAILLGVAVLIFLLLTVGPGSIEGIAYLAGIGILCSASDAMPFGRIGMACCGGVITSMALMWTSVKHQKGSFFEAAMLVLWGTMALWHNSPVMGFVAVAALIGLLGFRVIPSWGGYVVGWTNEKAIRAGTFGALLVSALGIFVNLSAETATPALLRAAEPFSYALLLLGSVVGLLGLLIMSSVPFFGLSEKGEVVMRNLQFIAVAACYAVLGTAAQVPVVMSVAGWVGLFWVLEKLYEVDLGQWGWFFKFAGAAGACYGFAQLVMHHPELFNR